MNFKYSTYNRMLLRCMSMETMLDEFPRLTREAIYQALQNP
jgi:uncharacterized protein (DUF433 family)